jgi:hypothetical protein
MKYSNTKLGKYKYLIQNVHLKPYLPETYLATKENIRLLLKTNKSVFLKPNHGTGGYGIYKISKLDKGLLLQSGFRSQKFASLDKVYTSLLKVFSRRRYLAQKGIPLLKFNNRPFDVRVMVQKNPTNHWEVTGVVGRLAKPKKIVTNYHSGGTPLLLEGLLSSHLHSNKKTYINKIRELGVHVSKYMSKHFSKYRSFGIDVAIDSSLKPWILEVNTRPDKHIFNALKDKSMYRKILKYGR